MSGLEMDLGMPGKYFMHGCRCVKFRGSLIVDYTKVGVAGPSLG